MSTPQLALLPDKKPTKIVIGTTVRKPLAVLRHWAASLVTQELPPNTEVRYVFVDDNNDVESSKFLRTFETFDPDALAAEVLRGYPAPVADFREGPSTHEWSDSAMQRVGANKDKIIARARELDADYLWFVDSDLICDPTTLKSLIACKRDIATAVYWTYWNAQASETRKLHAAPQVWLKHPYQLSGAGYTEAEFRGRLANRQLTPVAGYGACTLLNKRALSAGVSFARVPGVPVVGMMAGEDRHFCIRAQMLHLSAVADPWPDVFHIYNLQQDLPKANAMASRLLVAHPERASLGDLVNITLEALEPIPWAGGGFTAVPAQHARGRLGALPLMPEIEEAIYGLKRGDKIDVPVHFPAHHEFPHYQGKRRIIRVTLNDCKPYGFAPTLEGEMFVGPNSGAAIRTVDYTTRQLEGMREVVNG